MTRFAPILPIILAALLAVLFLAACRDEAAPLLDNPYEYCCGDIPVEFDLFSTSVFIPSAFSPDADGINDYFQPYIFYGEFMDSFVYDIRITDEKGFHLHRATSATFSYHREGWDGQRYVNGEYVQYEGRFLYELTIRERATGRTFTTSSSACALRCENSAEFLNSGLANCIYGLQHNGMGEYERFAESGEPFCD